jgi:FkbM family methyltransferase
MLKSLRNLLTRMRVFSNWYRIELAYAGIQKIGGLIKTRRGLTFAIQSIGDLHVLDETFVQKVYDIPGKNFKYDTVIDIGAYIGDFSLYAASVWKAKKVFSFEPSPNSFSELKKNIGLNKLEHTVFPFSEAIDKQNGIRDLYVSNEYGAINSLYSSDSLEKVSVKCITLKDIIEKNDIHFVDYLKLDCEGAEWEILNNLDSETARKIKVIGMEFHLRPRCDFVNILDKLGYRVFEAMDEKDSATYIRAVQSQ